MSSLPQGHSPSDGSGGSTGVGLSNPQLSQVLGRRQMLDLVNRLHSTGLQVDIDLPQIAVIGSQSVGKSSLIESISGITLPHASGTCTRCPTECRLSHSEDPWKCVIKLSRTHLNDKPRSELFGDPIYEGEKHKVEDRIRRAQLSILNPSKSAEPYLSEDWDKFDLNTELYFSKDCVMLEISGPDVADLSFCDLPGLIATVGSRGNKSDIDLIRSFVVTYIKKPSCIILLTVACETDFQNQGAQELAKEYDPDGKRTIDEKERLDNNWYCVRQPGPGELKEGMTWAEARKLEETFFSTKQPWNELEGMYQKYLRTGNLVERLSSILSDLILKRLPEIQEGLEKATQDAESVLQSLPPEPSKDPQNEIAKLLHNFVTDLGKHIEGVPDVDGLLQAIRPAQEYFRCEMRGTAPEFFPFEKKYKGEKNLGKAEFLRDEEGEDSEDSEGEDFEDERPTWKVSSPPLSMTGQSDEPKTSSLICIDEVFERVHQARTRELYGHYPFVVQETFIKDFIKQWNKPMTELCSMIFGLLGMHVQKLITKHFESFGQGELKQRVKVLIQEYIQKCMRSTQECIAWILALEDRPFSLNTHSLADYKAKFLAYYKGAREQDRNPVLSTAIKTHSSPSYGDSMSLKSKPYDAESPSTGIAKTLAGLSELAIPSVRPEDLFKLLRPDPMEPALVIMAEVRAYFQVAYKRFADNVPLAIDYELVRGITRDVLSILNTGLGINGLDGLRVCKELAQENPRDSNIREETRKKLDRLKEARKELLDTVSRAQGHSGLK